MAKQLAATIRIGRANMVRLKSDYAEKYPHFHDWLREEFVHVAGKPPVMEAFWKWSAFKESPKTRRYFQYGSAPEIVIADFPCEYADVTRYEREAEGKQSAMTDLLGMSLAMTFQDYIGLNTHIVKEVNEVVARAGADKGKPEDPLILRAMEATIMHEMVHWSYMVRSIDEQQAYGGDAELGTRYFEREAYGQLVHWPVPLETYCTVKKKAGPPWVRAYLGVNTITEQVNKVCEIWEVAPGSPAETAGLFKADVILRFNGLRLYGSADLSAELAKKEPGDKVTLAVRRPTMDRVFHAHITLAKGNPKPP